MKYTPSVNIEYGAEDFHYIVTPNALQVTANIVSSYQSGTHSFTIIGSYGTGKSSFLLALERDLNKNTSNLLRNNKVLGNHNGFEILNIVGDYDTLSNILSEKIRTDNNSKNIFETLLSIYQGCAKQNKMLVIAIDEFGKILEHAAKNNPEKELYFIQKFAEFVNVPSRNILLINTLHQNFSAYASGLNQEQKNEWAKVKGRFKEVIFAEPVEQLLYLTSEQLASKADISENFVAIQHDILKYAVANKYVGNNLQEKTVLGLAPLDALSAMCITKAIQRYGQNERTLFSFLTASGTNSVSSFVQKNITYNLANVYDYITYNFFSGLQEVISDASQWTAMRVAIERVENGEIKEDEIDAAIKIVKAIGLLNLFGTSSARLSKDMLVHYASEAMGISDPKAAIASLESHKIIRFASYKSSYILFDGTDIDLEDEMYKAANIVPRPQATIENISPYINSKAMLVSEIYYQFGTPRYFEFVVKNAPEVMIPSGDVDGYIQMVFPLSDDDVERAYLLSGQSHSANIYAVFMNVDDITSRLYEIHKLEYLLQNIVLEDKVAQKEVNNQIEYEKQTLNSAINETLISENDDVIWIYGGKRTPVHSLRQLNKLMTEVCREIYYSTPVVINELFNRQKLSSAISLARVKLLDAMIDNNDKEDFGFDKNSFPPEKAIYYTLFKKTGIHCQDKDGICVLDVPTEESMYPLWEECEKFIESSVDKPRRISDLIKILKEAPFKLKQGFIDFWIPIFLFVRQQSFAVYNANGAFVMNINKEFFELLQKHPQDYTIKAFNISGVKIEFFKKYQQFLNRNEEAAITSDSIVATFKPFIAYYHKLNNYAKSTNKFDSKYTAAFRDVLATAKDPEKAFFEDIPRAFGFKESDLSSSKEILDNYLDLIHSAIRELNMCYDRLIQRIEQHIISSLALPRKYEEYKRVIETRYKDVKKHLLPPKCRVLLERILAPSASSKEFIEKISNAVIDKRLSQIKDNEEERLIEDLLYLFGELDQFVSISSFDTENGEVYNINVASNTDPERISRTIILPEAEKPKVEHIMSSIQGLLTGDTNIDSCILMKLLNNNMKK